MLVVTAFVLQDFERSNGEVALGARSQAGASDDLGEDPLLDRKRMSIPVLVGGY
jgi:hypothetical protein